MKKIFFIIWLFISSIFSVNAWNVVFEPPVASTWSPVSLVNNNATWLSAWDLFCEEQWWTFIDFVSVWDTSCAWQWLKSFTNNGITWNTTTTSWCAADSITCEIPIFWCTHSIANNYDPLADTDDWTCEYNWAWTVNIDFQQWLWEEVFTKEDLNVFYAWELAIVLLLAIISYINKIIWNKRSLIKMF